MLKLLRKIRAEMRSANEQKLARERRLPPAVLEFWRDFGRTWARDEASAEDRAHVDALFRRAEAGGAPRVVRQGFERQWRDGFEAGEAGVPWTVIPAVLPDAAYFAFAEGASQAASAPKDEAASPSIA